jgi:hypothetical protein
MVNIRMTVGAPRTGFCEEWFCVALGAAQVDTNSITQHRWKHTTLPHNPLRHLRCQVLGVQNAARIGLRDVQVIAVRHLS